MMTKYFLDKIAKKGKEKRGKMRDKSCGTYKELASRERRMDGMKARK